MSKDDAGTDPIIADFITELGEVIDNEEWELIDEKQAGENDVTETQLNLHVQLARVPSSFPNVKSEIDTSLFKVRYVYAGSLKPEREFCKKMMSAGKVYRKEDLELAASKAVNPGFGPFGSDTYEILFYKGGPNCKHFWQRQVYLKRNNESIFVKDAQRIIKELEPQERAAAELPSQDPLITKKPIDMPNNGYLPR
jgi:hypothetical protein